MASRDILIKLVQRYLRNYPTPDQILLTQGMLKLIYSYSNPYINSKTKKQMLVPIRNFQKQQKIQFTHQSSNLSLLFDDKTNILKQANSFEGILTQQAHEKILQDDVFGKPHINDKRTKWVYIAKKKAPKTKSYFLKGNGKHQFKQDFGETYQGVNDVGIFIWDLQLKKIVQVNVKIQGQDEYIFSSPIFANDDGSKVICHGYKRTQFTHGLLHCFNRPVSIFQINITKNEDDSYEFSSKILINKEQTNIFPNISVCRNYLIYFGGKGITHTYYMDLVILKRQGQQWIETHRRKNAFVGYYDTAKSQTFQYKGQPYLLYQTIDRAQSIIRQINLRTGDEKVVAGGQIGRSYCIQKFNKNEQTLLGRVNSETGTRFFHMQIGGKPEIIEREQIQDLQINLQQFDKPIPGFLIESKNQDIKRQKKPLILLVHGGPHGAIDPTLTLVRYLFLKLGYAILMPNYSGSVGFGPSHLEGALGNIGKKDAEQIIALLEHVLLENSHLDKEKVHIYGGSYGGYMGGILGSRYQKYFKSAIIMNGALALQAMLWFTDIPQWTVAQTCKSNQYHKLTHQSYKSMIQQSPILEPMKIPTLQFLGAKDLRVPPKQGHLFEAIAKKHGTPFKTFVYENAGHSLADSIDTQIDVAMKSIMFFQDIDFINQQ